MRFGPLPLMCGRGTLNNSGGTLRVMRTIDPDQTGGFMGNGASWFRATGESTYAPDGSISWEYRDAYNSEPLWASSITSSQADIPQSWVVDPEQSAAVVPDN